MCVELVQADGAEDGYYFTSVYGTVSAVAYIVRKGNINQACT